jgi:hypothetical protein
MAFCALLVESLNRPTVHFSSPFVKELVGGLVMGLRHILHCDGYVVHRKENLSIDHVVDLLCPFDDVEVVEVVKYLTSHILPRLVRDEEPIPPSFLPTIITITNATVGVVYNINTIFTCTVPTTNSLAVPGVVGATGLSWNSTSGVDNQPYVSTTGTLSTVSSTNEFLTATSTTIVLTFPLSGLYGTGNPQLEILITAVDPQVTG